MTVAALVRRGGFRVACRALRTKRIPVQVEADCLPYTPPCDDLLLHTSHFVTTIFQSCSPTCVNLFLFPCSPSSSLSSPTCVNLFLFPCASLFLCGHQNVFVFGSSALFLSTCATSKVHARKTFQPRSSAGKRRRECPNTSFRTWSSH